MKRPTKTTTRPRLLVIGPLPPPANGMTLSTKLLVDSELSARFDLTHLDTSDHRDISNVARVDLRNVWLALKHGAQCFYLLIRHRPSVVYLPVARNRVGFLRDALFLLPARLARKRVVIHFHSWDFDEFRRSERAWMRGLIRLGFGSQTHVIVLADSLRGAFGSLVPPEHVHVVANGVRDLGPSRDAADRDPIVLHLSTLWSEKGVFDVLELARRLRSSRPQARFVLAGPWYDPAEEKRAMNLLRAEGLQEVVRLTGHVEDEEKDSLLREAAVLVMPSRWEGQPLVVLEALAAGTPVVSTGVGALPDTITDGGEGFLIDIGDVAALERHVVALLRDRNLRGRLGRAARSRYEAEYSVARFVAGVQEVLTIVATHSGGDRSVRKESMTTANLS